ncbi:hypothetical protein RvY_02247 [Ramazzottius varieornatus]|uniref:Uncharacterized protein n=1 Tax=Ramazzottius varieornatus TaxID=947166 RepID=A0A1D1UMU7_RAMVA|nr:hypothetical protein RvY_02247 [Ramazzottius varieornatus]
MKQSFYSQCFSILVKSFLRELFGETYAQRIVLCDSLLLEDLMTISIVAPDKGNEDEMVVSFNRFFWVRSSMKDLTLWNCRVLVKPLTPGGHTEIVLANFSFRLEKEHKALDMICAFRDACCPRPDITACKHHIQSGLSLREAGPEVMENAQTASRTSWLKQYVSRIPEDIGKKNAGEMDFYCIVDN